MGKHFSLQDTAIAKHPLLTKLLERILLLPQFANLEKEIPPTADFVLYLETIFQKLNIQLNYSIDELAKIPTQGPVIVTANHPFGGIDAAIISFLCLKARGDTKILANYLIGDHTPFSPIVIGIDPFQKNKHSARNIGGLKEAQKWLRDGNMLATFPSGTVSHWQLKHGKISDPDWHPAIARLAMRSNATIVPLYFHGHNSWYFQLAGLISGYLRTLMLPQQFFAKRNSTISLSIGQPILSLHYKEFASAQEQIDHFRQRTYLLAHRASQPMPNKEMNTPIAKMQDQNKILAELRQLPPEDCMLEQGEFAVYLTNAEKVPCILKEIGRLREITFRQSGEGTNKELDLDEFDAHYMHIFLWDKKAERIAGAYRLGFTDLILPKYKKEGLYISTLYELSPQFIQQMEPGIEMGRSFVIKEYQRKPQSLVLLWKGIIKYIGKNPQYRTIYGAISISRFYQPLSRDLIVKFFQQHSANRNLNALVKSKKPYVSNIELPAPLKHLIQQCSDLSSLDQWIREIEYSGDGLPILLKHYHSMSARVIGFNLDDQFNNTLDCLFLSYINEIPLKKMEFYMGKEEFKQYQEGML